TFAPDAAFCRVATSACPSNPAHAAMSPFPTDCSTVATANVTNSRPGDCTHTRVQNFAKEDRPPGDFVCETRGRFRRGNVPPGPLIQPAHRKGGLPGAVPGSRGFSAGN